MKINLDKLLKTKGKTLYWLSKETGISYPSLHKIVNNNTESIKFKIIEDICKTLDCTLDELFTLDKDDANKQV